MSDYTIAVEDLDIRLRLIRAADEHYSASPKPEDRFLVTNNPHAGQTVHICDTYRQREFSYIKHRGSLLTLPAISCPAKNVTASLLELALAALRQSTPQTTQWNMFYNVSDDTLWFSAYRVMSRVVNKKFTSVWTDTVWSVSPELELAAHDLDDSYRVLVGNIMGAEREWAAPSALQRLPLHYYTANTLFVNDEAVENEAVALLTVLAALRFCSESFPALREWRVVCGPNNELGFLCRPASV